MTLEANSLVGSLSNGISGHLITMPQAKWTTFFYCRGQGVVSPTFRELSNIISRNLCTSYENFKLKLCTCAQNHALGTRTKFQLEILTINVISGIVYFRKIILESSRNVSETTPWHWINLVFSSGHGLKDTFIEYSFTHWKYLNSIICHCICSNKLCRFIYIAIAFAETKYLN